MMTLNMDLSVCCAQSISWKEPAALFTVFSCEVCSILRIHQCWKG